MEALLFGKMFDLPEVLKKLFSLASLAGRENQVQLFLKEALKELGFRVDFQEVASERFNLIAERGEGGLLFVSTIDAFPLSEERSFFSFEEGWITGPGVLSSKGQVAALLKALSLSKSPVRVAFLVDEGGKGVGARKLEAQAEGAIVLKPTSLKPCWRGAGLIEAELEARGKEANSACWGEGQSALQLFLEVVDKIKLSPALSKHYFFYGRSTANIIMLAAGENPGLVPEQARGLIEIPLYPPSPVSEILGSLENICLEKRVSLKVNRILLPFESDKKNKVARALERAWREEYSHSPPWSFYPGWSEAADLLKRKIPPIVFGAGDLARSLTREEKVSQEELEKLTSILVRIIDFWSGVN